MLSLSHFAIKCISFSVCTRLGNCIIGNFQKGVILHFYRKLNTPNMDFLVHVVRTLQKKDVRFISFRLEYFKAIRQNVLSFSQFNSQSSIRQICTQKISPVKILFKDFYRFQIIFRELLEDRNKLL